MAVADLIRKFEIIAKENDAETTSDFQPNDVNDQAMKSVSSTKKVESESDEKIEIAQPVSEEPTSAPLESKPEVIEPEEDVDVVEEQENIEEKEETIGSTEDIHNEDKSGENQIEDTFEPIETVDVVLADPSEVSIEHAEESSAEPTGSQDHTEVQENDDAHQDNVISEGSKTSNKKKNKKKKNKKKNANKNANNNNNEQEKPESNLVEDIGNLETVETQDVKEEIFETIAHDKNEPEQSVEPQIADTRIGRDDPFEFGKRNLTEEADVWDHNAWDNVEWGEEQIKEAEEKISVQHENPVSEFDKEQYNGNPARYWDIFYKNNRENFFKDRKWLQIEFPILYSSTKKDAGPVTIFEIGCGAGNTFFPILNENENEHLKIIAADFSPRAVELVKTSDQFNSKYGHAAVWDLANEEGALPEGVEEHSVDIAVMIFVFSALAPNQWDQAMENLHKLLKPGGKILFRDYGRYDLAQVRFKKNRLLDDNFYIRGDGTRVYFFAEEELRQIFTKKYFTESQIGTDRRLLVNRKRLLKMYRCWVQAVFEVPK